MPNTPRSMQSPKTVQQGTPFQSGPYTVPHSEPMSQCGLCVQKRAAMDAGHPQMVPKFPLPPSPFIHEYVGIKCRGKHIFHAQCLINHALENNYLIENWIFEMHGGYPDSIIRHLRNPDSFMGVGRIACCFRCPLCGKSFYLSEETLTPEEKVYVSELAKIGHSELTLKYSGQRLQTYEQKCEECALSQKRFDDFLRDPTASMGHSTSHYGIFHGCPNCGKRRDLTHQRQCHRCYRWNCTFCVIQSPHQIVSFDPKYVCKKCMNDARSAGLFPVMKPPGL